MKTKEQVIINGKPAFYATIFNSMKKSALELGYTLSIHGSMHNDIDLIAVAWVEDAKSPKELIQAIEDCIGMTIFKEHNTYSWEEKPHGRIAYTISFSADWYIDLSIIPPGSSLESKIDTLQRWVKPNRQDMDGEYVKYSDLVELLNR